ncbi:polyprenyl synthetase family protein [Streptomyces lavendulae]|uniref:polyprenyl synthetase family protein n=1 Tax=Streptomyces lavendulae TaxID=1914 RepID=UPI0031EA87A3
MSLEELVPKPAPFPSTAKAPLAAGRTRIDTALSQFLADKEHDAANPQVSMLVGWLKEFLAGGKRLRPLLCCYGWRAACGAQDELPGTVTRVAASLELFHAFALIHDDVMDDSDTRRGRPAVHRLIADRHPHHPAAEKLGRNMAILLGDLALGWSYELARTAGTGPAQSAALWPLLDAMRVETMTGQYLDLLGPSSSSDLQHALKIYRYKTAKYTIDYPLRIGASLAGATPRQLRAMTAYATPLGEAFQMRDDLLGVFGDPQVTGKPCLDDLREGKHTALIALAYQRAAPAQARLLRSRLGDVGLTPEQAEEVRALLAELEVPAAVEQMIDQRHQQAIGSLTSPPFTPAAITMLRDIALTTVDRDR